ncbi:hypothetical protein D3C87_1398350 [compost metagenome]
MVIRLNYFIRKASINYGSLFNNWGNAHTDYYLRWQKPGDENFTNVPSLPVIPSLAASIDKFYSSSNLLVLKGDHIRLNDIRVSYNLNKYAIKRLPFSNASIYMNANNLGLLWTANKSGVDPDNPAGMPPVSRTLAFGLNLNF